MFKIVPHYKSMEANCPQGVANFDHSGMVGRHLYTAYTYFDYCNVYWSPLDIAIIKICISGMPHGLKEEYVLDNPFIYL